MSVKTIRYKYEPPEGGWGILICFGMAFAFTSPLASMPCFGLLFRDFLKGLGEETGAIAVITSSFFSAMSFAGLFTNYLFQKFSIRTIAVAGGTFYFIGNFLQIFAQSTWHLLFAFSLLQGIGFGLIVPASYTTFNHYFVKKRVMMMSFAQSLIGVGTMIYPLIIQHLMSSYGFRGCLLILSAINSHAILGMLLMQPVEWHLKKVAIVEQELQQFVKDKTELKPMIEANGNDLAEETNDEKNYDNKSNRSSLDPVINPKFQNARNSIDHTKNITAKRISMEQSGGGVIHEVNECRKASSVSWNSDNSIIGNEVAVIKKKPGIWKMIVDFLDLTLLKKPVYVNLVMGVSCALFSDVAFFTLQSVYLFELNFSELEASRIIAFGAAADLFSRVFLAFSSAFIAVKSRYVYLAGAFFTIISRFAFLHVFDYTGMVIITAILGFLRTWIHVPLPLVFGEYLPKERFPSGYGLFMFFQGNFTFAVGPIAGYIRDSTGSYPITFHFLNLCMAGCAVPWIIEILFVKFMKKSKKENPRDPEKSPN